MSGDAALTMRNGEMRNVKVPYYRGTVVGMRLKLLSPTAPRAETVLEPVPEAPPPAKA
jgi:hypothetical protein